MSGKRKDEKNERTENSSIRSGIDETIRPEQVEDDIVITVVEMRGAKVRLGIEAPKDVPVHRRD